MFASSVASRCAGGKVLRIAFALAALALTGPSAFAGEGQGGPFDVTGTVTTAYGTIGGAPDVGSETYPPHAGGMNVAVRPGNLLPASTDTAPDVANSLPPNFMTGTAAWAEAQTLNRWFAAQRDTAGHMLARSHNAQPKG
jgi:hypothetical protein